MNLLQQLKDKKYSILASNGYYSYESGIKPVIDRLNERIDYFMGLEVADKIIGKASAMLLTLSGVKSIDCMILSASGKEILDKYHIEYHYEQLVGYIINRKKDGMCPMEKTVESINDLKQAYEALNIKVKELKNEK